MALNRAAAGRAAAPVAVALAAAGSVLLAVNGGGGGASEAAADDPPRAVGLLSHWSFERDTARWRAPLTAVRRTLGREAPDGDFALRALSTRARGGEIRLSSPVIGPRRGALHTVSARVRAANPGSVRTRVRLRVIEAGLTSGPPRVTTSRPITLTPRYRFITLTTGRVVGRRMVVQLISVVPRRGTGFDVDAVNVTQSTRPSPARVRGGQAPAERAQQRPYDPRWLINSRIPDDARLHPRSRAIVAELARNVSSVRLSASVSGEVPPVYVARPTDRMYRVEVEGLIRRFRIPADAVPGTGDDHPLVVLDPRHPDYGPKVELRVYRAEIDHRARVVRGEGVGLLHYNNDGERLNPDGTPSVSVPFSGSGTGSGLSFTAGLLRPSDLEGGIEHAIRVAWACNDFVAGHRPPAVKSDQSLTRCPGPASAGARVEMGMRLRLDPRVDCDARRAPQLGSRSATVRGTAFVRTMCRALQRYGMVILDGTRPDGLALYLESNTTARWDRLIGPPRFGAYSHLLRDETSPDDGLERDSATGIPWSRMQVIR